MWLPAWLPAWLPSRPVLPNTSYGPLCCPQDGLRLTYKWIKGELEKESKEGGKDIRWAGGVLGWCWAGGLVAMGWEVPPADAALGSTGHECAGPPTHTCTGTGTGTC